MFCHRSGLIYSWMWATEYELALAAWLYPDKKCIPSGTKETVQVMILGIVLVTLFYSTRDALMFSVVFTVYSTVVCLLVYLMNKVEIPPLFKDSIDHLNDNPENWGKEIIDLRQNAISILDSYFLRRPHTPRHILILLTSFVSLLLALYGELRGYPNLLLLAYALIFITILVSEIVIFYWRNKRDSELRPIYESLKSKNHDIYKLDQECFSKDQN